MLAHAMCSIRRRGIISPLRSFFESPPSRSQDGDSAMESADNVAGAGRTHLARRELGMRAIGIGATHMGSNGNYGRSQKFTSDFRDPYL